MLQSPHETGQNTEIQIKDGDQKDGFPIWEVHIKQKQKRGN